MKRVIVAVIALLATTIGIAKDRASPEHLEEWLSHYYVEPHPEEVPSALRAITEQGLFEKDSVQAPLSGFFTEVFRANPDKIAAWIKPYLGVPNRHIIYSALWIANSEQSRAALESLAGAAKPEEAKRLRGLLSSPPPTIASMEIDSPASLDYLWGAFMATGADAPVVRVIDQMKRANTKGNVGEMLIGGAAEWSVSANARQHTKVLQIVRAKSEVSDSETKASLREILSGIEREQAKK
jgi:hypothetical protein